MPRRYTPPWIQGQILSPKPPCEQNHRQAVADLRGGAPGTRPPTAQNFLNFMQFLGKSGKFMCWRPQPSGELATPSKENLGSASHRCKNITFRNNDVRKHQSLTCLASDQRYRGGGEGTTLIAGVIMYLSAKIVSKSA